MAGWDFSRVITIRHSALLASRFPPRLSRCRLVFPEEAGIGDAAQVRPRAFAAQPFRMVPGGDQQQRGGVGADAVQPEQARRAGGHQGDDELIEALELGVQELDAAAELA